MKRTRRTQTAGRWLMVGAMVVSVLTVAGMTGSSAGAASVLASDTFSRTTSNGFGSADAGGAWSIAGTPSNFSVSGGAGRMVVAAANQLRGAYLPTLSSTDVDSTVDESLSSAPTAGTGYLSTIVRRTGTNDYRLRVRLDPGAMTLQLLRTVNGTATTLASKSLVGGYSAGSVVHLRLQALGTGTTSLNGKVWFDAQSEPSSWTVTATDATAALQVAGGLGLEAYLGATFLPVPATMTVDNLNVTSGGAVATPPTASFTAAPTKLAVAFTNTSTATGGTIVSQTWDFGDGSPTSTVANPNHTYATAGTYQVTLTVTDSNSLTGQTVRPVTVVANAAPTAAFTSSSARLVASFTSTSSDSDGTIVAYSWDFGDASAVSTLQNPGHTYASAGTYQVTLTVTDNDGATGQVMHPITVVANATPTASFTSSSTKLVASFTSTSTDSDGTVVGYSWDFGDGSPVSTVQNPGHTYASAGTYQVTLTVTDNDGGTGQVTNPVSVVANQPPSASFTSSVSALTVNFNASASSDPDGTIVSYSWDFGDDSLEGPGVTTSHTYATGGTYQVTLTLTDNDGATSSVTQAVQPVSFVQLASDAFSRAVSNGFGTAVVGGAWSIAGTPSNFTVGGGTGRMIVAANQLRGAYLPTVSTTDVDSTVDLSLSSTPTAGTAYLSSIVRRIGTSDYRLRVRFDPGAMTLQLLRGVNGTLTTLGSKSLGVGYSAGSVVHLRLQALGTGATSLNGKVWFDAQSESSSWTLQATDVTAALQAPGGLGVESYLTANFAPTPVTMTVDNLNVTSGGTVPTPLVAAFTSTANKLAVAFTNTSTDSAGTIVGQSWDFGDGSPTSTVANPNHTYATAGTYQVTLTVTDSNNLTAKVTQPVYVANVLAPPGVCGSGGTPPATYHHIVVIMEENRRWSDVGGVGFGSMPYLHSLATQCSTFADWTETDTAQSSLTQYIGLTSGVDNPAVWNDCSPSLTCRSTDNNIFRQVRVSGGTTRSFVEGATTGCSAAGNADRHIPALYYYGGTDHDYCNTEVRPLTELDVNNLPTFAMITPNLCNDGHDCPNSAVDAWDTTMINSILAGANYQAGDTAIFVMYDEDYPVPNLLIAPTAASGILSTSGAGHAAMLKSWEQMLGLPVMNQGQLPTAISLRTPANI
jgi:PKD repeat protein